MDKPVTPSPGGKTVHLPLVDMKSSLHLDGSRAYVHPADVKGRFATARKLVFVVLLAVYVALPWINVGGHPAVFLDIESRSFFLFGASFNAQDIWMLVFVVTGAAFGLVFLTAAAGRVWCGWACPQTVFLEALFRRLERLLQGPREKRLRRNAGPLTWDKVWRKTLTHLGYVVLAFLIAHVLLAYFVSVPQLLRAMQQSPAAHPEAFAVVAVLTGILLFNFAWFREQFCVILCPYGRLQSALLDPDSLVIGYEKSRGEPRGKAKKADATAGDAAEKHGDCVDCGRCVTVCPTGIDIRNGLQMDCVACTACIDACDEIMDKLNRPRGLIRYDSMAGLVGQPRRFFRPRIALYLVLGAFGVAAATFAYGRRVDFESNVLRVQGPPYTLEGGLVRNAFTIHIVNKRSSETVFLIEPVPAPGATFLVPLREVRLKPLAQVSAPVFVTLPANDFVSDRALPLRVVPKGFEAEARTITLPFLGPKR